MSLLKRMFFSFAVVLLSVSGNSGVSAQTVIFNASGSSAMFLSLGRVAFNVASEPAHGAAGCVWSQLSFPMSSSAFVVTDSSPQGGGLTEVGQEWVVWSTGTAIGASCMNPSSDAVVLAYQQTDSVVGVRCLSNGCSITTTATTSTTTSNLVFPSGEQSTLPSNILSKIGGSGVPVQITAAGTDIRPEDALFASQRALTPCGMTTDGATSIAPYLGLGYSNGDRIKSFYSEAAYHVVSFFLPLITNVTPIGATPILVVVNHRGGGTNGFGDPNITNMNSGVLANFLDGTYSQTNSAVATLNGINASEPVTVLLQEPLSGAYNAMEYNSPNTVSLQSSQDVGVNQIASQRNCSGIAPRQFELNVPTAGTGATPGARTRVIGTYEATKVLFDSFTGPADGLTYTFWSAPNLASALASSKYLTVDGVDPLFDAYTNGSIPTTGNLLLPNVTLSHIQDGSYPLWSVQRIVDLGGAPGIAELAAQAQLFPAFGPGSVDPDYIPISATSGPNVAKNLGVVRSHFQPAGQALTASNGTNISSPEAGGDVGGVVFTIIGDMNFNTDFSVTTGETGRCR